MYFDEPKTARRSDADRAAAACWRSRACSTCCSSSIRRRWSARPRWRRSRCSSMAVALGPKAQAAGNAARVLRPAGLDQRRSVGSGRGPASAVRSGSSPPSRPQAAAGVSGPGSRRAAISRPAFSKCSTSPPASPRRSALPPGWRWRRRCGRMTAQTAVAARRPAVDRLPAEMAERRARQWAEARRHPAGSRRPPTAGSPWWSASAPT